MSTESDEILRKQYRELRPRPVVAASAKPEDKLARLHAKVEGEFLIDRLKLLLSRASPDVLARLRDETTAARSAKSR